MPLVCVNWTNLLRNRYFEALAKGEVPPVKSRLEQPLQSVDERLGGITKGILAVLHKQVCAWRLHESSVDLSSTTNPKPRGKPSQCLHRHA